MATLHVELAIPALRSSYASSIHGRCVFYDALTISGTRDETAAVTAIMVGNADLVARLVTDTDCFIAVGSTPDETALVSTGASSAKRFLAAGSEIALPVQVGDKISVVAA